MHMEEREKFKNDFIERLIKRSTLNERNEDKDIKEVAKILKWMLEMRKNLLEVVNMIIVRS